LKIKEKSVSLSQLKSESDLTQIVKSRDWLL